MLCHYSPLRMLRLLLLCCLLGAASLAAALYAPTLKLLVICWMGFGVFAIGAAILLLLTLRTGVAVEINDDGIIHHRKSWPLIRWKDVTRLATRQVGVSSFLCIHTKDPQRYGARPDPDGSLSFGFAGLKPGFHEVLTYLHARHGSSSATPGSSRV